LTQRGKVLMSTACWQLDKRTARFTQNGFEATLNVGAPHEGMRQLRFAQLRFAAGQVQTGTLLQVSPSDDGGGFQEGLEDAYVRGPDLIATYSQTEDRPFRTQIYWRGTSPAPGLPALAVVDLIASVQTSLLDSQPEVTVASCLPADQVWRTGHGPLEPIRIDPHGPVKLTREGGPYCVLCRLSDGQRHFAQMIHPSDCCEATLAREAEGTIRLAFRLFSCRVEKGVILRARLRSVFLRQDANDVGIDDRVCAWYRALMTGELPITT
jgi:hypothetical protein